MSTYTIGEVAGRSGFSASALRYYEGIGLVPPAARTDSGYRLYDDRSLARLAFIARAKQLGCSLEEITDLVGIWEGETCGPVQRRFHDLVTHKLKEADDQIRSLSQLAGQLRAAAAQLAGPAVDGPCDDGCACLTEPAAAGPTAVTLLPAPPIACTLDAADMPGRLAAWKDLLTNARSRGRTASGAMRVEFGEAVRVDEVARLAADEQYCCAFFSFAITVDQRGVGLEVDAPNDAADLVESLFGAPA